MSDKDIHITVSRRVISPQVVVKTPFRIVAGIVRRTVELGNLGGKTVSRKRVLNVSCEQNPVIDFSTEHRGQYFGFRATVRGGYRFRHMARGSTYTFKIKQRKNTYGKLFK